MDVSKIIDSVNDYLEKEELVYQYDEEIMRYDYGFRLEGVIKRADCLLIVDSDGDGCILVSYPEIGIESKTRSELEHLLFQINCHMLRGSFQIVDDEIRYVTHIRLEGEDAVLTHEMLDGCVYGSLHILDHYSEAIVSVIVGVATPDEKIKMLYSEDESISEECDEECVEDIPTEEEDVNSMFLWIKGDQERQ